MLKLVPLLLVICVLGCSPADDPEDKESRLVLMLESMGALDTIPLFAEAAKRELKRSYPGISSERWTQDIEPILREYEESIREAYVKTYSNQYSERDVDDILAFYGTPVGKRMLKNNRELIPKLEEVGRKLAKKYRERLSEIVRDVDYER